MAGEFDFIRWVRTQQTPDAVVRVSAGDDLAVLQWPHDELLLAGVDQVLDRVHFDLTVHTPRVIGRKVMNRNLSDCAAMACLPATALVSLLLPRGGGQQMARELYTGIREAAEEHGCTIAGGETGSWEGKLAIVVTILGRSAGIEPVLRSGARPGDGVYVTGPLGGSLLGRHMTFTPRVELARQLASAAAPERPTAMIDLSDGVSRDLRHICERSGVGAIIDAAAVPVHDDAHTMSRHDGRSAVDHALNDGEDYELLFTCAGKPTAGIRIGTITGEKSLLLEQHGHRQPLATSGWEHTL